MDEAEEILKRGLFPISDLAPGTQLVDVDTGAGTALGRVCETIKKILPTDHARCWDAGAMGLQDELRNPDSPIRAALAEGFYKLVVIEVSRGLNSRGQFQYDELFLPYLRNALFEAFAVEPTYHFHPEQISQVLKDEPRSLFCFFDAEHLSEADSLRLRGFTQEFHRVLLCARKDRAEPAAGARPARRYKVQLVVVQGKPEGKVIPVAGPRFKIGRGESCHLRPDSQVVSREHAEFAVTSDSVSVRDLGSRNGTLVNGKVLTGPCPLKHKDQVQVGPLTFAVSIEQLPDSARSAAHRAPRRVYPEDDSKDDIESWLVADASNVEVHDQPSGVAEEDTVTVSASKGEAPSPPAVEEDSALESESDEQALGDIIDEMNPFYVETKANDSVGQAQPRTNDTSEAASEILRKMMERRRKK